MFFHHFLYGHIRILKLYWDTGNVYKSHIPGRPHQLSCKGWVAPRRFPLGGGTSSNCEYPGSACVFFCDPIRSKVLWKWGVEKISNQWKRGSIGSKIKRIFIQNALNLLNNTLWWNITPTLGHSIYRTKYDREKLIFLQKEMVNRIVLSYKIWTQSDWKFAKWGSPPNNLPTMHKYVSAPLPLEFCSLLSAMMCR